MNDRERGLEAKLAAIIDKARSLADDVTDRYKHASTQQTMFADEVRAALWAICEKPLEEYVEHYRKVESVRDEALMQTTNLSNQLEALKSRHGRLTKSYNTARNERHESQQQYFKLNAEYTKVLVELRKLKANGGEKAAETAPPKQEASEPAPSYAELRRAYKAEPTVNLMGLLAECHAELRIGATIKGVVKLLAADEDMDMPAASMLKFFDYYDEEVAPLQTRLRAIESVLAERLNNLDADYCWTEDADVDVHLTGPGGQPE
jgi:DNA repair exonuclease SbcCD ATPase subunit